MTRLPLTRRQAGNYVGLVGRHRVEILNETSDYGDSGWWFYIDSERCDYPRSALWEARAHLALNLRLRHQEPYACHCGAKEYTA